MKEIYEKYAGLEVKNGEGIIVGYNDDKLVAATKETVSYSFRRYDKEHFIEEAFKDKAFRYFYVNEADLGAKVDLIDKTPSGIKETIGKGFVK